VSSLPSFAPHPRRLSGRKKTLAITSAGRVLGTAQDPLVRVFETGGDEEVRQAKKGGSGEGGAVTQTLKKTAAECRHKTTAKRSPQFRAAIRRGMLDN